MANALVTIFPVWVVEREAGEWKVRAWGLYSTSGGADDVCKMLSERAGRFAFYEERFLNG